MKTIFLKFTLLAALLLVRQSVNSQTPDWSGSISCILYSHCTSCHNPSGIAPFSLLTYSDALAEASSILTQVQDRKMPPFLADINYREYAHQKTLSQTEINEIADWVNAGSPSGDTTLAPVPPVYTGGSVFVNPDFSESMPVYTIPALSMDMYRCFIISNPFPSDAYITAFEVIPGNRAAVHHVLVYSDPSNVPVNLDNADPDPGYISFGGTGSFSSELIGGFVPGSEPYYLPQGMGMRVEAGSRIIIQVHYPVSASGLTDSTRVNFLFSSGAVRNATDAPVLNHSTTLVNGPLFIPADSVKTFYAEYTVPIDVTVLSVAPHAHLVCTSMRSYAVVPAGDTIPLVDIPEWDFHWQGAYYFQQPVRLPPGTVLYGEATYDNTSNNPENPNNPPQDVSLGESTTDEMMLFYFVYLEYQPGDENIVIDTSGHLSHYLNCTTGTSIGEMQTEGDFEIFPSPAGESFTVSTGNTEKYDIRITTLQGKTVMKMDGIQGRLLINSGNLKQGMYLVYVSRANTLTGIRKMIIR